MHGSEISFGCGGNRLSDVISCGSVLHPTPFPTPTFIDWLQSNTKIIPHVYVILHLTQFFFCKIPSFLIINSDTHTRIRPYLDASDDGECEGGGELCAQEGGVNEDKAGERETRMAEP